MPRPAPVQFRDVALEEQLEERVGAATDSKSAVAKRDLERYYYHLAAARRSALDKLGLSENEALFLCDLANGTLWEPHTAQLLWAQVADGEIEAGQWNVDAAWLAQRLRTLTPFEAMAVADALERWWAAPGELSHAERLEKVGLAKE